MRALKVLIENIVVNPPDTNHPCLHHTCVSDASGSTLNSKILHLAFFRVRSNEEETRLQLPHCS